MGKISISVLSTLILLSFTFSAFAVGAHDSISYMGVEWQIMRGQEMGWWSPDEAKRLREAHRLVNARYTVLWSYEVATIETGLIEEILVRSEGPEEFIEVMDKVADSGIEYAESNPETEEVSIVLENTTPKSESNSGITIAINGRTIFIED